MAATVYVNGRISGEKDAVVSVFDHGLLYGEGVYEVCRTYNQVPFLYGPHMQRLRRSAAMIALDVPFSDDEILARITETQQAAAAATPGPAPEWYIRLLLTRGVGELSYDPKVCPTPTTIIIVKPNVDPAPALFEQGARVAMVTVMRNHPKTVNPMVKSNNLLNNALAMQEALRQGAFEAVMRNYRGEISECSQSNLFIVKNGEALTPPLDAGLLPGITRGFVFEVGNDVGIPVFDRVLHENDLFEADEAFLTSTTKEIIPIVKVDDRAIGTGVPGPVTKRLLARFRERAWATRAATTSRT